MEPIINAPNTTKAIEVIWCEEAEVTKMKAGKPSFATFGPMSVLYLPAYNRFTLQINDWRYPLLRRLSTSGSNGSYTLPGPNGATFALKITKPGQGLANLDALLECTRKMEASPDDKLVRIKKSLQAETGPKEVITETIKQAATKVQNKVATLKTGTKNLTSTKKRMNLKDIKTKKFRREARSKLKKDFFESSDKMKMEFLGRRKENLSQMSKTMKMDDLKKTSASHAAVMYIPQLEIEDLILRSKEMCDMPKKTEMMGRERMPEMQGNIQKTPVTSGMTHYQG